MIFAKLIVGIAVTIGLVFFTMWIDDRRENILGHHMLCRVIFLLEILVAALALLAGIITFFLLIVCALTVTATIIPQIFSHELYEALMLL